MNEIISELNENEKDWVSANLGEAEALINAFAPEETGKDISPEILDKAWKTWILSEDTNTEATNTFINMFGIVFGQLLVEKSELKWVAAKDEFGMELALFGYEGRGDILIYPPNLVAKRWDNKEKEFFARLYIQIMETIGKFTGDV